MKCKLKPFVVPEIEHNEHTYLCDRGKNCDCQSVCCDKCAEECCEQECELYEILHDCEDCPYSVLS
jgi:hypothetical protein